ncbi:PQQ-dependent sugar dehydrogenase [Saccharopolyspora rhizosphaerae]|uniref:PQQ-dependent sugar dehydrogenase n=1 Tax=Saccharopolyspora rhizosphaerae TaxID=2492662 RepID=A0A3R8VBL5_9PSEU|nr:PQQ-dependent sugar dehydrogenase [Saccharopolyspora rhizosphaerae]RRO14117.1 PQQ-dependent sugar dehydrogenase [Saccharopolyspora rhizosphaerae]
MALGTRFAAAVLGALVAVTTSSACAEEPPQGGGETAPARSGPTTVVDRLVTPWSVVFAGETPIISERDTGRILEVDPAGRAREIGVVAGVVAEGESGLLGLALSPDGFLHAYSTGADGNRIQRYPLSGAPGSFQLGAEQTILAGLPSAHFHDGGRIAFGPDGMLYATVGEAGNRPDAQDLASLGGKILRMTPDGGVPPDNPFPGSLVYSYGHRNPQGIAWAPDGTLYASEFGQNTWDELNVIVPGGNYGWPTVEGIAGRPEFTDPVQQWGTADASPSGIAVHGGSIYLANLRGERLREVPLADPGTSTEHFVGEFGRLRDVVVAPDGALRVLTSNTDGRGAPAPGDDRMLTVQAP